MGINATQPYKILDTPAYHNAVFIKNELDWLVQYIDTRLKNYFDDADLEMPEAPEVENLDSVYARVVDYYEFGETERVIIALALVPHIKPQLLDVFFSRNQQTQHSYSEFGGLQLEGFNGFVPTFDTAFFLIAGNDLHRRIHLNHYFSENHFIIAHHFIQIPESRNQKPNGAFPLLLSQEILSMITDGYEYKPGFSRDFPAKAINTSLEWDDLILDPTCAKHIEEIRLWMEFGSDILDEMELGRMIKPGYKTLFYGPPGTGKTLTAALLGKYTDTDVYRIDLSMVVSKYIGETEKNLENVFKTAENKNWILFFDEADALFGKRTSIGDSHDKYANQEIAYLLQRLEDYPGLVILASNLKGNVDEAFSRRLQSVIHFPMPSAEQRLKLWQNTLLADLKLEESCSLIDIAEKYELAGGSIINIVRYVALLAKKNKSTTVKKQDLLEGIRREYAKDGRTI